jgi:hypothetical protein
VELRKEVPAELQNSFADKVEPQKATEAVASVSAPVAPAAPVPAAAPVSPSESLTVGGALSFGPASGQQGQAGGGRGGGGRGALAGARAPFVALGGAAQPAKEVDANAVARFAFDYSITPDRRLRILAASDGFLTVSVSNGDTAEVLLAGRPTQAASTVEVQLPLDSAVATIVFARNAGAGAAAATGGAIDALAGTKTDPTPSPNSRLQAIIPLPSRE